MNLQRAEFKDKAIERQMIQDGFVYIPNFLHESKVRQLKALYETLHTQVDREKGMWNSMYDVGKAKAIEVSGLIKALVTPELEDMFECYSAPVASFMSKNPGCNGVCELHRDFSVLDENNFEYRNVWIPLIDINQHNGALYALKGSHSVFNYPLPMFQKWPYIHMQQALFEQADFFTVKAGDLVVYADRTLHGSMLNNSAESRPVVHLGLLHPNSDIVYYHISNNNVVKVFEVPFEFYFENNFTDVEGRYPIVAKFVYSPPSVTLKEFVSTASENFEN